MKKKLVHIGLLIGAMVVPALTAWARHDVPMRIRIRDDGNTVEVRDAETHGIIREFHLAEVFQTALNAFIRDGRLVIQCGDGKTRAYDIHTGALLSTTPTQPEP